MTTKRVRDLAYGDLFELADLPPFAEVDDETRRFAELSYARYQGGDFYDPAGVFWLDTSFGFFAVDPDLEVVVHRNESNPFSRRNKK